MQTIVSAVIVPAIIVISVLVSCMVAICYYQWLMYRKERKFYERLLQKEQETIPSAKNETSLLQDLPVANSLISSSTELIQCNSIAALRAYLGLKNLVISTIYNYELKYMQICVKNISLYPLPENVHDSFVIFYKLIFSTGKQEVFESNMRALRSQNEFDETWRLYPHLSSLEDSEMICQVYICEHNFRRNPLWCVKYKLKQNVADLIKSNHNTQKYEEFEDMAMDTVEQIEWQKISCENEPTPMIHISLCYKPTAGRIYFNLIEGRDFPKSAHDFKIRVMLLQTKYGSVRSFYSQILPNQSNPSFDATFTLGISIKNIQSVVIIVSLMYGIQRKSFTDIAEVRIGGNVASEQQQQHWNKMLESVREDAAAWHPLTSSFIN